MEGDTSVKSVDLSATRGDFQQIDDEDAHSSGEGQGPPCHQLDFVLSVESSSAVGTHKWSVTFTTAAVKEAPCASHSPVIFHSIAIACEECHIKIWIQELSISLEVQHGIDTWDTLISDVDAEPVQHSFVASDTAVGDSFLLKLLLSIAVIFSGTTTGGPSDNRSPSWQHSVEIYLDNVSLTCVVDTAEVRSAIASGLTVHCRDGASDDVCTIRAPGFALSSETGLPYAKFESEVILSFDSITSVRPCLRCILSLLDMLGIAFRIPILATSTMDGWAGTWTDITRTSTDASAVAHLTMNYVDGTTLALSGMTFDITGQCTVDAIDTLYIPGICSLSTRKAFAARFSLAEKTVVKLSAVHMILLRNLAHERSDLSWPSFPWIEALIDEVVVEYQGKIVMEMQRCCLAGHGSDKGFAFSISCAFLESRMISTVASSISGRFTSKDVLSDLVIRPGAMSMVADLRTFDWSMIRPIDEDSGKRMVLNIPHGIIESFSLSVDLQNAMLSIEKPHVFPSFQGSPNATTNDFGDYVVKLCVNELPKLYTKTRVMGERATDLTAKAAGRLASSSVVLSAIGSIGALILTDAFRAFSKLNVLDYVLLTHVAQRSTNIDDESHSHTDSNVMVRLQRYVSNNRTRFGSAAGSAFGIAIGTALYGLPGMMLGNMLGGKIAAAAIGQSSSIQDVTGSIAVTDDATSEWVFVDFLVFPSESAIDTKAHEEADVTHVKARRVFARQDKSCPSAPMSLNFPAGHNDGPQSGDERVPSNLLPASGIDASEGYLAALQQKFFAVVRRHRKQSQWHSRAT